MLPFVTEIIHKVLRVEQIQVQHRNLKESLFSQAACMLAELNDWATLRGRKRLHAVCGFKVMTIGNNCMHLSCFPATIRIDSSVTEHK